MSFIFHNQFVQIISTNENGVQIISTNKNGVKSLCQEEAADAALYLT